MAGEVEEMNVVGGLWKAENGLYIRPAQIDDQPEIEKTFVVARGIMKKNGNPNQWGDTHPLPSTLWQDMVNGNSFVVVDTGGAVCGTFSLLQGPDPTYARIESGAWLNSDPYVVVHRLASNGKRRGVFNAVFEYSEQGAKNIRVDTHRDNKIMQKLLSTRGYVYCGVIYLADGQARLAYQKVVTEAREGE